MRVLWPAAVFGGAVVSSCALAALAACAGAPARGPAEEKVTFVQGGAGRLRVSDGGGGEATPIVFVHGLGSDLEVWREQLQHFRPSRRAVAYDQRGNGQSDPAQDGNYSIQAFADDLDQVVRQLKIRRFVLVGHSMAGAVLSAYAGKRPDKLAALVYVDAVGNMTGLPRDEVAKVEARESAPGYGKKEMLADYGKMVGPQAKPSTRERVLESASQLSPRTFAAVRHSLVEYDPRPDLAHYTGPKIAIEVQGNDSPIMASNLPGMARRTVPNVSHWLMLDDPAALDRELDAFLAAY